MRIITKEYQKALDSSSAYNFIKNTPKPDRSNLHKLSSEFETWIKKEHEKDRKLIREAAEI
ncbi:MAG: hypothetical protein J5687_09540 [Treponema sp.]|nr:hypothetical protein [Treponema sp.]